MPIRYVRDMDAARRFYEALGLEHDFTSRRPRRGPSFWTELAGPRGALALHHVPDGLPSAGLELSFEAEEPLEDVIERLRSRGYEPATEITDEEFGRAFTVRDPEGLMIQVNEHDRDLES